MTEPRISLSASDIASLAANISVARDRLDAAMTALERATGISFQELIETAKPKQLEPISEGKK